MKTIQEFIREKKRLRKPTKQLLLHIATTSFLGIAFGWLSRSTNILALSASAILISIVYFRCFALMHDAVHNAAHPNQPTNNAVGVVFGALCFLPFWPWKKLHIEHHQWSGNVEKDPVMRIVKVYPAQTPEYKTFLNFNWQQWIPYMAFLQHVVFWVEGWKRLTFSGSRKDTFYNASSVIIALGIYSTALALLPSSTLLCGFAGFLTYLVWVEVINFPHHLDLPQHTGDKKFAFSEQYQFSRSCHYPKIMAHYFLNNFNYHTEHHMFPHLPWYELAEIRPLIKEMLGNSYNESQGSAWIIKNKKRDLANVLNYQHLESQSSPTASELEAA